MPRWCSRFCIHACFCGSQYSNIGLLAHFTHIEYISTVTSPPHYSPPGLRPRRCTDAAWIRLVLMRLDADLQMREFVCTLLICVLAHLSHCMWQIPTVLLVRERKRINLLMLLIKKRDESAVQFCRVVSDGLTGSLSLSLSFTSSLPLCVNYHTAFTASSSNDCG